jgi:hypothetical protein
VGDHNTDKKENPMTTTTNDFYRLPTGKTGRFASPGCNEQDGTLPIYICSKCGEDFVWATSKRTGNKYRVNVHFGEKHIYIKSSIHECDPIHVDRHQYLVASKERQAIELGEVTVGCQARVAKGRKFPIGTEGKVFWIANEAGAYGVITVGMETTAGEKIWINLANLERI